LDWVIARRKNLTAIYVTHGHGDHFFGLESVLERFPSAKAVATPEIVKAMQEHISPAWIDNFWRRLFPGEIPDRLLVAEPLEGNDLELEGHKLVAVNTGRTDTAASQAETGDQHADSLVRRHRICWLSATGRGAPSWSQGDRDCAPSGKA
jgi:hypothetical protein